MVNTQPTSSTDHIMNQVPWNNQYLRIDGKPQFCKRSYMAGMIKIKDILLPDGKLKPWDFFRERDLNANNYFLIFGLSRALPDSWRVLVNSENPRSTQRQEQTTMNSNLDLTQFILHSNCEDIDLKQLTSKKLFWILVEEIRVDPSQPQY